LVHMENVVDLCTRGKLQAIGDSSNFLEYNEGTIPFGGQFEGISEAKSCFPVWLHLQIDQITYLKGSL
jgi:hypothetical protein